MVQYWHRYKFTRMYLSVAQVSPGVKVESVRFSVQILITKLHCFFELNIFFYVVIGRCVALLNKEKLTSYDWPLD